MSEGRLRCACGCEHFAVGRPLAEAKPWVEAEVTPLDNPMARCLSCGRLYCWRGSIRAWVEKVSNEVQ